ncbi:hypothetical protein GFD17_06845 [Bifidobacterium sp. SMB2]|uniref:Antitoxin n=1 Tax=Bifidobacterium saimiriisciurei TaxID=2661627 RepID=A0ABX0CFP7_9BIFI|nr:MULTISPECIES: hypothetical protein [Bifidobacterium]NEG96470.1 hypothetical protein [Bifidobacterium sp. SMB2]NEH11724.1 hypothetical protein [Bifidobacterium saimiriisciurei]
MDEKTLVEKMKNVVIVDDVLALAKELGLDWTYEQADEALGRINATKNDIAELAGDTMEKVAKEVFGI